MLCIIREIAMWLNTQCFPAYLFKEDRQRNGKHGSKTDKMGRLEHIQRFPLRESYAEPGTVQRYMNAMTKEQYLDNSCRAASIPYWKAACMDNAQTDGER